MSNEAPQELNGATVLIWGLLVPAAVFALLAFAVLRWHWSMGGYVGRQQADGLSPLIPIGAGVVAILNGWTLLRSWAKVGRVFLAALVIPTVALILLNLYIVKKIQDAPLVVGTQNPTALARLSRHSRETQPTDARLLVGTLVANAVNVVTPANNRLKLTARGRSAADARLRTRAAA